MTTITRVQHYLAEFDSPDDLAATCRFKRLTGTPLCTSNCIVAELIRDAFPEVGTVEIIPDSIRGPVGELYIDGRKGVLPDSARRFALAFDDDDYWDLIEPAARVVEPPEDDEDDDDTPPWEDDDVEHGGEAGDASLVRSVA